MKRNRILWPAAAASLICIAAFGTSFAHAKYISASSETATISIEPRSTAIYQLRYYDADGTLLEETEQEENAEITVRPALDSSGDTFSAWEGTIGTYIPGSTFVMPASDVDLYAKYENVTSDGQNVAANPTETVPDSTADPAGEQENQPEAQETQTANDHADAAGTADAGTQDASPSEGGAQDAVGQEGVKASDISG